MRITNTNHTPGTAITNEDKKNPGQPICSAITPLNGPTNTRPIDAIADKSASANGTTWYDRTNYYEILSASDENLRWAIDMEADRMINSKILPEELKKEFSVVRNEFLIFISEFQCFL